MKYFLKFVANLFLPIALQATVSFTLLDTEQDIEKMIHFLVEPSNKGGASYLGTAGELKDLILPMSYYSTADYWGAYVAKIPGNDCTVKNIYNSQDYTLTPSLDSPGVNLQIERVNVYNGTNIYDASTWQIALALAGQAGIKGPNNKSLFDIADHQNHLLSIGYDGQALPPFTKGANRAISQPNGLFSYNGQRIQNPNQAYFFRMVTKSWLSTDPFKDTDYEHYISVENLPANSQYQLGKITWLDWKPITGENAWAFLLGSLQSAYLHYNQSLKQSYIPYHHEAVQNAFNILYAFRCMQSPIGGIYYAVGGSLGNVGSIPVNSYEISVENNASLLAGLLIFKQVLQDELKFEMDLSQTEKEQIQHAIQEIDIMVNGGSTPQNYTTEGLLAFFKNYAWNRDRGFFYQGGLANDPQIGSKWRPNNDSEAVDVTTWGVTVIGQPLLDKWFGFGSAYQAWENVKQWGGFYGSDQQLWGVGYSDQDSNGPANDYRTGILSGEWTAGAINMVRALMVQYDAVQNCSQYNENERALAKQYVAKLFADEKSMVQHLTSLRSDRYSRENAYQTVRPENYDALIALPKDHLAYLYASKRYFIPFGWLANPLPSTASTAWAIMLHYNYNPFKLGGDYTPYFN